MKTLALTLFFLTALLNISIFNSEKVTEIRITFFSNEQNNKETVDKSCTINCKKAKTNCPLPIKTKLPAIKSKATNYYHSSFKEGFVIVDPILTYSI